MTYQEILDKLNTCKDADDVDASDERRKLRIAIMDCGTFAIVTTDGDALTVENSGGCPAEELLAGLDLDDDRTLQEIADDVLDAWMDGYEGDPSEAGLTVEVRHGYESATAAA